MRHRFSLLIVCALAAGGCTSTAASSGPALVASSATPALVPATPLVMLDGTSTDLSAVLRGRPAIITLWATWCDGCLTEIDALKRLDAQTSARGDALVVGVAVGEPRGTVAAFARSRSLGYARWVDEDFRLADAIGERRVPATLVVDREGRIVYRGGALDEAGLAAFRGAIGVGVTRTDPVAAGPSDGMDARGSDLR
jgi:peroxiredoxin